MCGAYFRILTYNQVVVCLAKTAIIHDELQFL